MKHSGAIGIYDNFRSRNGDQQTHEAYSSSPVRASIRRILSHGRLARGRRLRVHRLAYLSPRTEERSRSADNRKIALCYCQGRPGWRSATGESGYEEGPDWSTVGSQNLEGLVNE
ncbi:MAG TPA: hypothetical protein VM120_03210 [Bryobacteraceae bacterium]|nr:hypothetical protein [Bryobacteraceae bacterium]